MIHSRLNARQRLVAVVSLVFIVLFIRNYRALRRELPSAQPSLPLSSTVPLGATSSNTDHLISDPYSFPSPPKNNSALSPICASYPKNADVVIVVKTGGTEVIHKFPPLLLTYLQCVPHDSVLLFSDIEQDIGPYHIHDSLDTVIPATIKNNPDFDLYATQKEYHRLGLDVSALSPSRARAAWILDKYKNIHTAQKAFSLAAPTPTQSWFFFIDADTYIVWANFFPWLARIASEHDPAIVPLYIGSRVNIGTPPFAHGGSGYLLSRRAMEVLNGAEGGAGDKKGRETAKEIAARYDTNAVKACCGDQEIARILHEKGINAMNARPMINGDAPRDLPFGPAQWCQPLVTMHHVSPEDVVRLWAMEEKRASRDLLLISDIYHATRGPVLVPYRDDWDNRSNDDVYRSRDAEIEDEGSTDTDDKKSPRDGGAGTWWSLPHATNPQQPFDSFNACAAACKKEPRCFQFLFRETVHEGKGDGGDERQGERGWGSGERECALSKAFKLGAQHMGGGGDGGSGSGSSNGKKWKVSSGWDLERIEGFVNKKGIEGIEGIDNGGSCEGRVSWDTD